MDTPFNNKVSLPGSGYPVVFLHGYLESKEIWRGFSPLLKDNFRLIIPDLPGHGKAKPIAAVHTMELMADYLYKIINQLGYKKVFLVGHSLGGYVTLAFVERYSRMLSGYCLFHSHPLSDSEEVIANRIREINLVKQGKKALLVNTNIPKAFAVKNIPKMAESIAYAQKIAAATPDEGIIAMLKGMMQRPDRRNLLLDPPVPALWILGKQDQYISYENMKGLITGSPKACLETLSSSGHMGFMEEPERSAGILSTFIKSLIKASPQSE